MPRDNGVPDTFVISDEDALARFRRDTANLLGRGAYQHIELALPVAGRERFERRINARYRACGCLESAVSVALAIAALTIWNVAYSVQPGYAWSDIALDSGIVLLAGAVGKVTALVRAHFALGATLRELAGAFGAHNHKGEIR